MHCRHLLVIVASIDGHRQVHTLAIGYPKTIHNPATGYRQATDRQVSGFSRPTQRRKYFQEKSLGCAPGVLVDNRQECTNTTTE